MNGHCAPSGFMTTISRTGSACWATAGRFFDLTLPHSVLFFPSFSCSLLRRHNADARSSIGSVAITGDLHNEEHALCAQSPQFGQESAEPFFIRGASMDETVVRLFLKTFVRSVTPPILPDVT